MIANYDVAQFETHVLMEWRVDRNKADHQNGALGRTPLEAVWSSEQRLDWM